MSKYMTQKIFQIRDLILRSTEYNKNKQDSNFKFYKIMEPESGLEMKTSDCQVNVKNPRRVLHFSDGTLEEYSDSEEQEEKPVPKKEDVVDASTMGWGPWLMYKAVRTGNNTLAACDYVGEALASFLGITTPKYQYELDEYMRLERARKALEADKDNANGWLNAKTDNDSSNDNGIVSSHPSINTDSSVDV